MLKYTCKKDSAISNLTSNNLKGYYIFMYKYIITKNISKKGRDANMTSIAKTNDTLKKNREQFTNELVYQSEVIRQAHNFRRYVLYSKRSFVETGKLIELIGSVLYFLRHTFFIYNSKNFT